MRCFDKLSMTLYFYFNVSGNVLADLLMAEKQKNPKQFKICFGFFILYEFTKVYLQ